MFLKLLLVHSSKCKIHLFMFRILLYFHYFHSYQDVFLSSTFHLLNIYRKRFYFNKGISAFKSFFRNLSAPPLMGTRLRTLPPNTLLSLVQYRGRNRQLWRRSRVRAWRDRSFLGHVQVWSLLYLHTITRGKLQSMYSHGSF